MNTVMRWAISTAWQFSRAGFFHNNKVVSLLYHGTPRREDGYGVSQSVFESHLLFLKEHFDLVHPNHLEKGAAGKGRDRVLLTFDDGFRNNAEVAAPLLRKHRIPAVFFVSTGHCQDRRVLWFAYLAALRDHYPYRSLKALGERFDRAGTGAKRVAPLRARLLELRPHPTAMVKAIEEELPALEDFVPPAVLADSYYGMTPEQVAEVANDPLFTVGVHTVDHPYLTRCDDAEGVRQIAENKRWLEGVSGKPVRQIAYPGGDYGAITLECCRRLGITLGFGTDHYLGNGSILEVPRFGIYSGSPETLGFKIKWGGMFRSLGLRLG
jgi:peptidoglycan/xylan/chitin deacetylase (PgdA/CDA1 family)